MKKTKLLSISLFAFFVFILNPEKAFSVASSSQIAVNQSFVEKIPKRKWSFFSKIKKYFIQKVKSSNDDDNNFKIGKESFRLSMSGILLQILMLPLRKLFFFTRFSTLITMFLFIGIFLSLLGFILGLSYLYHSDKNSAKLIKKRVKWAIILGYFVITSYGISFLIYLFF
jgi:hypothetical protein